MRHLGSMILSLVIGAALLALVGTGSTIIVKDGATGDRDWAQLGFGIGVLVCAGVLFALLILPRLSPLGPVLTGLGLLAVAGWVLADAGSVISLLPRGVRGDNDQQVVLFAAALLIPISIPLVLTVFSGRRWRRYAYPATMTTDYPPAYSPTYSQPYPSTAYADQPASAPSLGYPAGRTYDSDTLSLPGNGYGEAQPRY